MWEVLEESSKSEKLIMWCSTLVQALRPIFQAELRAHRVKTLVMNTGKYLFSKIVQAGSPRPWIIRPMALLRLVVVLRRTEIINSWLHFNCTPNAFSTRVECRGLNYHDSKWSILYFLVQTSAANQVGKMHHHTSRYWKHFGHPNRVIVSPIT